METGDEVWASVAEPSEDFLLIAKLLLRALPPAWDFDNNEVAQFPNNTMSADADDGRIRELLAR
jgi:hypothetical protein